MCMCKREGESKEVARRGKRRWRERRRRRRKERGIE